jgi:hypothetical protein
MAKRGAPDDDEDDIVPARSAKRGKLSSSPSREVEDEEEVVEPENNEYSDNDDEDDGAREDENSEDEGEFEETSPADIESCTRRGHSNAGVLDSVRLDRFMSHECFEYKLGPNVNIINGPNGEPLCSVCFSLYFTSFHGF